MRGKLFPIVAILALAACGTPSPNRMHVVDVVSGDGQLGFEIKMNGCWVFDAVVHNRSGGDLGGLGTTLTARSPGNEAVGSIILVFPATKAGGQARAVRIHGATGIIRTARDSRAGLKPICRNVHYNLTYY